MADVLVPRPGFRDLQVRYVDMGDTTWAEKVVAVNPNGTVIGGGGGGGGIVQQGARDATAQNWLTDPADRAARLVGVVYGSQAAQVVQTPINFNLKAELAVGATLIDPRSIRALTIADVVDVGDRAARALGVVASITAVVHVDDNVGSLTVDAPVATPVAVRLSDGAAFIDPRDVSDRAARLVGVVYGSQAQQVKQTAVNFNLAVETFVGAAAVDPRSIRALTIADVVDVGDRAAREAGRVRIWDGTDEATVLPVRVQPATTEKVLLVGDLPIRTATYAVTTITVSPAITIGVKELLALWYTGGTKDIYIVEIWAAGIVTTASTTGGRTTVRVSTITTAPTGGTEEPKVDVAGGGASAITNAMRVKTGGGAIGATFIRKLAWHATQAIGSIFRETLFAASNPGNGLIMRGGASSGFSIDVEREVAHTALVDSWTVGVRWLEL